jgi:hypothetical protein
MTTSTQPGWYDDPEDPNAQRYWDGNDWTPHRQRKPSAAPPPPPNLPPPAPPPNLPPAPAAYQPPSGSPPPAPNVQFDQHAMGYQSGGPPTQKRNSTMLAGIALVVALSAVGGFFGYKYFTKKSPEDQIRSAVEHVLADYNASHFEHDAEWQCKANAGPDNNSAKEGRDVRAQTGTVSASVANIQINGDKATADVSMTFEKAPGQSKVTPMQFVNEDGRWKECTPPTSDSSDGGN